MDSLDRLKALAAESERLAIGDSHSAPKIKRLVEELTNDIGALTHQRKELASLYDVARDLAAATDLSDLLESVVDKAIVLVGAERGFVVLAHTPGEYRVGAARRFASGEAEATEETFSSSLVRRVMKTREPILTTNVQTDGRFELSQSILFQDIRSVLAVPLVARGELQGAIYVDTRMSSRHFSADDLRLLQAMASQAATAVRGARLYEDVCLSNEQLQATLADLREAQTQLVQAERLAAVGRLAASVAHELRSPLMVMRNGLYYLDRVVSQGDVVSPEILKHYFAKLDVEIDRQSKIINDLLFFSRNRPRRLADVDLNAVLIESLMRVSMPESIRCERRLESELMPLRADADQLQQVCVNLITNAVQAMPDGGTLTVSAWCDGDEAVVQVADTGVGIPEDKLNRLFVPFFTTKEKGIGLGLSVSQSIVEGHRGTISVESAPGVGTTFTVRLPFELVG